MKKTLFLILLSWLTQTNGVGQNLDSLWSVWQDKSKPDTSRLKAINDYAKKGYLYAYPDSAFYFAQMQLDFAQKKGLKSFMADALNTQGISFNIRGDYPAALKYYFKSLKIKEEVGELNSISGTLANIGIVYDIQSDYPKALEYYFKSLEISEKSKNYLSVSKTLGNIGNVYFNQSDFEKCEKILFRKFNNKRGNW